MGIRAYTVPLHTHTHTHTHTAQSFHITLRIKSQPLPILTASLLSGVTLPTPLTPWAPAVPSFLLFPEQRALSHLGTFHSLSSAWSTL